MSVLLSVRLSVGRSVFIPTDWKWAKPTGKQSKIQRNSQNHSNYLPNFSQSSKLVKMSSELSQNDQFREHRCPNWLILSLLNFKLTIDKKDSLAESMMKVRKRNRIKMFPDDRFYVVQQRIQKRVCCCLWMKLMDCAIRLIGGSELGTHMVWVELILQLSSSSSA